MSEAHSRLSDDDRARLMRAIDEYFDTGASSVECDGCRSPISVVRRTDTVWEHRCACGKFNGTMRGL